MSCRNSFRKESLSSKIFIVVSICVIILAVIVLLIGVFYFGFLGLFHLLGIHYDSLYALFIFTLLYILFGCFADIFEKIIKALVNQLRIEQDEILKYGILFLSFSAVNLAVVHLLDFYMLSISIHFLTQIILSMLLAILDIVTD